jgi:hypothetical protein
VSIEIDSSANTTNAHSETNMIWSVKDNIFLNSHF